MCIPKALERAIPSPVIAFNARNTDTGQRVIADPRQYEADIVAVTTGQLSRPVTAQARLGICGA